MPDGRDREPLALPRLHAVTDDATLRAPGFLRRAAAALAEGGGALALHVRGPGCTGREVFEITRELCGVCKATGSLLVVNDRVDVALALGLHAVHLGGRSLPVRQALAVLGPEGRAGVSVHAAREAGEAADAGAGWVFVGTVFASRSHPGHEGRGTGLVADAVARSGPTPVLAIGGVQESRVRQVMSVGAYGVAVLGGLWNDPDPAVAVSRYLDALAGAAGDETEGP